MCFASFTISKSFICIQCHTRLTLSLLYDSTCHTQICYFYSCVTVEFPLKSHHSLRFGNLILRTMFLLYSYWRQISQHFIPFCSFTLFSIHSNENHTYAILAELPNAFLVGPFKEHEKKFNKNAFKVFIIVEMFKVSNCWYKKYNIKRPRPKLLKQENKDPLLQSSQFYCETQHLKFKILFSFEHIQYRSRKISECKVATLVYATCSTANYTGALFSCPQLNVNSNSV